MNHSSYSIICTVWQGCANIQLTAALLEAQEVMCSALHPAPQHTSSGLYNFCT